MSVDVKFVAKAVTIGGRNGRVTTDDGLVKVALSIPKIFGGSGASGSTTPEHLFAAGYSACFGSAIEFVAGQQKKKIGPVEVEASVGIGARPEGGFGLAVELTATLSGITQVEAEQLVEAADQACPYSNAIRRNVDVKLRARVLQVIP